MIGKIDELAMKAKKWDYICDLAKYKPHAHLEEIVTEVSNRNLTHTIDQWVAKYSLSFGDAVIAMVDEYEICECKHLPMFKVRFNHAHSQFEACHRHSDVWSWCLFDLTDQTDMWRVVE